MSARTLRRLERAAMRMVDRNGWLREPTITKDTADIRRRHEFEDAVAAHAERKGAKRKGHRNGR